jgi:predicted Zn finger-like uncharacterized protein
MLTTCPECATTFRLTQEQLGARRGMVRCGHCNAVFNAYDNLRAEIEAPAPEAARTSEEDIVPPASSIDGERQLEGSAEAVPETTVTEAKTALPGYEAEPDWDMPGDAKPDEDDVPPTWMSNLGEEHVELQAAPPVESERAPLRAEIDDILLSDLPGRERAATGEGLGKRVAYGVLAILLVLAFLAQLGFYLRAELVTRIPELRAPFAAACAVLGCAMPLARDLDALRIDASSLETDPEQAAHARLRVTFSNRSVQTQEWPHFVLKLSDVRNTAMAQRVFKPREYLGTTRDLAKGMPSKAEQEFRLDLDLGTLSAAGYEVKPYYP